MPVTYAEDGGYQPAMIALADMNRDGRNDLVTVNSGNEVTIRDGKKSGGFGQPQTFPVGADRDYYGLAVARINADKRPDIAVTMLRFGIGTLLGFYGLLLQPSRTTRQRA